MAPLSAMMSAAATAPFVCLTDIIGEGGLVVLAPHPDDESLGCGGLLRAAACAGRPAVVVVITDGRRSHPGSREIDADGLARLRSAEVRSAVAALHPGIGLVQLGYRDGGGPHTRSEARSAAKAIIGAVDDARATALVAAWGGDPHADHGATAVLARHAVGLRPGLRLWSYPIWGRFAPAISPTPPRIVRFDCALHRAAKTAAIACHRSQMTRLIDDDPSGFMMAPEMQAHFIDHPEVFLAD